MRLRAIHACAVVAILVVSGSALAAGATPGNEEENEAGPASNADAKKRFTEGNERYARGDYDGAIESFKAAIAADPKLPGPYRNLGLAYRALNRCSDALPVYEKYLELKPESRFTERVRREIELCRAKLGQTTAPPPAPGPSSGGHSGGTPHAPEAQSILHVAANLIGGEATDEATVKVDGLVRGATPLTIPITPGAHVVHLSRVGFESASAKIEVAPGERRDVELTMNKLELPPLPVVTAPTQPEQTGPKKSLKKYGWILIGVAAGATALGAGFGIAESAEHRDAMEFPPDTSRASAQTHKDNGNVYAPVAYAGLSVGGAALLAAAIVFIIDPTRGEAHEHAGWYTVAPSVDNKGANVVATVRF